MSSIPTGLAATEPLDEGATFDDLTAPGAHGRPLTHFRVGERGRLAPSDLDPSDRALLDALGLGERCRLRISKAGDPWIVQVRGTRIGLATAVAQRLRVVPDDAS